MGIRCPDHVTPLYPQKLALTSPTGGGRSVGIVRLRTKATEFFYTYGRFVPHPTPHPRPQYCDLYHKSVCKDDNVTFLSLPPFFGFFLTPTGMNFVLLPVCTVVVLHLSMMPIIIASSFVHYVSFQVLAVFLMADSPSGSRPPL